MIRSLTAILLARYTGARQGDCVRMSWSNVDLTAKVVRYSDAKTHKSYVVPLHARLEKHLRERCRKPKDLPETHFVRRCRSRRQEASTG